MTGCLRFHPEGSGDPRADLAQEEDLLSLAAEGIPALFCYRWPAATLVLGYGQDENSVDLSACRRLGVPAYRRITGGTGVLHQHALSICLALPASHSWCHSITSLYDGFVETLRGALALAGCRVGRGAGAARTGAARSPICFEEVVSESLLWQGRKVFGGAQARRAKACLVHGTLLFGLDTGLQAALYGVAEARIEASLGSLPPIEPELLQTAIGEAFSASLGLASYPQKNAPVPTPAYLARYATSRWAPLGCA